MDRRQSLTQHSHVWEPVTIHLLAYQSYSAISKRIRHNQSLSLLPGLLTCIWLYLTQIIRFCDVIQLRTRQPDSLTSSTATKPAGPCSEIAQWVRFRASPSLSPDTELLRPLTFSIRLLLCSGSPFRCLNLEVFTETRKHGQHNTGLLRYEQFTTHTTDSRDSQSMCNLRHDCDKLNTDTDGQVTQTVEV